MNNAKRNVRNDFEVVTREEINHKCLMAMEAAERVQLIFDAIARMAGEGDEIARLAKFGRDIAADSHNELDCLRECAEEAGLAGELVAEQAQEAVHG